MKKFLAHLIVFTLFIFPIFVLAQTGGNQPGGTAVGGNQPPGIITISNPFNCGATGNAPQNCTFISLLTAVLEKIVMPIISVVVVLFIIYAGFMYVIAQGNEKKIQEAHQRLLWALVGAGILLGAVAISKVVQNTVTGLITP